MGISYSVCALRPDADTKSLGSASCLFFFHAQALSFLTRFVFRICFSSVVPPRLLGVLRARLSIPNRLLGLEGKRFWPVPASSGSCVIPRPPEDCCTRFAQNQGMEVSLPAFILSDCDAVLTSLRQFHSLRPPHRVALSVTNTANSSPVVVITRTFFAPHFGVCVMEN